MPRCTASIASLRLLGISEEQPLRVEQLTPFDQYHYFGTDAVDEAIAALGLTARLARARCRLGAWRAGALHCCHGPGAAGRWRSNCSETCMRWQRSSRRAAAWPARSNTAAATCLTGVEAEGYRCHHLVPVLSSHSRPQTAAAGLPCGASPGGAMYVEDFGKPAGGNRPSKPTVLRVKVQCPYLPTRTRLWEQLRQAGFAPFPCKM